MIGADLNEVDMGVVACNVTTKNKYDQLLLHNLSKCMMSLYPKFYKSI